MAQDGLILLLKFLIKHALFFLDMILIVAVDNALNYDAVQNFILNVRMLQHQRIQWVYISQLAHTYVHIIRLWVICSSFPL